MNKKQHWTRFLPEVGTMVNKGISQEMISDEIKALKLKIRDLKKQFAENEEEIELLAEKEWTLEEIKAAKGGSHKLFATT